MNDTLLPVAILAGGLATRLWPLTATIPKPLLTVNDEPFIAHQLRLLQHRGIRDVVLCVGHLSEMIIAYVGNGASFGLNVTYVHDGQPLRGTGGAIKQALPLLGDAFFVLYGDSYLPCDYRAVQAAYIASQQSALMTVCHNKGLWDTSNVEYQAGEIIAYDKIKRTARMHHIDYGLGVMNRAVFDCVPAEGPYDLADLYADLLRDKQLAAYEVHERFYEAGSLSGIEALKVYLAQR